MPHHPNTPKIFKGGLVLLDPDTSVITNIIALQINPEQLRCSFEIQKTGEGGPRSEALRLTGPAVAKFNLEAKLDATDQLEFPDQNPAAVETGILPYLCALEMLINPPSARLQRNRALADRGTLEILPVETPLTVFVWGPNRIAPVQLEELSFTEEAFDVNLNPIMATVTLGLRVLSINDLGFAHRGGGLFMASLRAKEEIARRLPPASLSTLGIGNLP